MTRLKHVAIVLRLLTIIEVALFLFLIGLVLVLGSPARSAQMDTWSGAGPNACHGRCSVEWAMTLLTDEEHAQLVSVMAAQPAPADMTVPDGAVFSLATFYRGEPRGYRTHTVAVLDAPEPAIGWRMDGWSFVKLDDCSNWTIVTDQVIDTTGLPRVTTQPPEYLRAWPQRPLEFAPVRVKQAQPPTITWERPVIDVTAPPYAPPVTPVPLPGAMVALLTGLGVLNAFKRHA